MLNHLEDNADGGAQGTIFDQSIPTVASTTKDERVEDTSPVFSKENRWGVTKNDFRISTSTALEVMDEADAIWRQRLLQASPEVGVDIKKFDTSVARFSNSEIQLGQRLACGNFAEIFQIFQFNALKTTKVCTEEQHEAADELKQTCSAKSLVVKLLRAQLLGDPEKYATGAGDILTEATLLATLDHPNIIKLRGRSLPSVEGFASGNRDAFFLILERVDSNLSDRLREWQGRNKSQALIIGRREEKSALLLERLSVLIQIADALAYLHDRNIIHRDLKLSNIGMRSGQAILLDFGLAKVLPKSRDQKELFNLTGNTGSMRYMAPEVSRGSCYNLKADVFSFSILMFEVLSLSKAWSGYQAQEIRSKVNVRKQRPPVSLFWPSRLRELLKSTWSDLPAARLPIRHVHTILSKQIKDLSQAKIMKSPGHQF